MNSTSTNAKKSKLRFSVIDAMIIIVIISCTVGVILRYNVAEKLQTKASTQNAEVSFYIASIAPTSADILRTGDVMYYSDSLFGTIKSVEVYKAYALAENLNGEPIQTENDLRRDVRGVITVTGTMTADGFMLNGTTYIAAGKSFKLTNKDIQVTVLITAVNVLD